MEGIELETYTEGFLEGVALNGGYRIQGRDMAHLRFAEIAAMSRFVRLRKK